MIYNLGQRRRPSSLHRFCECCTGLGHRTRDLTLCSSAMPRSMIFQDVKLLFFTNIVTVFSSLSCFGFVSSLNGEPEKGIAVEVCWCFINFVNKKKQPFLFFCAIFCVLFSCINQAIGLESCESFQEETVSDDEGQYRLRGLQVSQSKWLNFFFLIVC